MDSEYECVVVGGGAAGLSAALVLGRARRRTLLIDEGRQSNLAAHGVGGMLGQDGRPPAEMYAAGRAEVAAYPSVTILDGRVEHGSAGSEDGGFELTLGDGSEVAAARLVLATGMDYRTPELPGLAELWGGTVFHCPFCHGWEVRDRPLGLLMNGDLAVHGGMMLRAWSDDVVILTDGPSTIDDDGRDRLRDAGVEIDQRPVAGLAVVDGRLGAVEFQDGGSLERGGLQVPVQLHQRTSLVSELGLELQPENPMAFDRVAVDIMQATSVPGIAAAGDMAMPAPQVAAAIATGAMAAASTVRSLTEIRSTAPAPRG